MGLGLLLPKASGPQDAVPVVTLGQSTTLLPDGRYLLVGGEGSEGPLVTASIWDPSTSTTSPVSSNLTYARAYHTATLLPDGTVLILGGIGANGQVVNLAEIFDPTSSTFSQLTTLNSQPTPRAYHTATLLTEGRVLIAGGISDKGKTLATAELWDSRTQTTETLSAKLSNARNSHTATLLSDGRVLLWGGVDKDGNALNNGELYDPESKRFTLVDAFTPSSESGAPTLTGSIPENGAVDVPMDVLITLRFSEPLRVETVNTNTATLTGPEGAVTTQVVPAEEGMLAFITPAASLLPGATYTLLLSGPTDRDGFSLPDTTITFTTLAEPTSDGEEWVPDATDFEGAWKTEYSPSPWQSLPPLQAEPGVTALAGQALKINGEPLAGVTLQIESKTARTDSTGRFLLSEILSGQHVLVIEGRTANSPGKTYGLFEAAQYVADGVTNILPYTIWMPKIDTAHAVNIPSPTPSEVVVTTPRIPGLEVHIPPQTVIRDRNGQVVTSISITPIPVDRPPFPLPVGIIFPVYFTIQPGGANLETLSDTVPHGARIIYLNYTNQLPGTRVNFWNYEPDGTGWYAYGLGTVTADGKQIIPDLGVAIYKFTGAMVSFSGTAAAEGPVQDGAKDGEPVDLFTGLMVVQKTDLFLPDVLPIALTRTYRQRDTASRPFGIGATHPYEMFLVGSTNPYTYIDLILPDGGRVHYDRISSGTGYSDAIYEHISTPTKFYKSRIAWNGNGWDLTLKDGTVYVFGNNAPLQSIRDRYGNKITLTRTSGQSGNITRITSPNGRWIEFTYDASNRITQAKDNIGRVVNYTYDASGRLIKVTDPNGGITEYTYDTSHRMLTLKDTRAIVFLTNVYDTNGRVTKQTQADTTTYQFTYTLDANGKVTQTDVTDPRGNVRRVTFSSSGYTLTDTRAQGKPEAQTITYERQAGTNLVLSVTDALGRKTASTYDAMGNVTSITRLSGTANAVTTTFTYEPTFNQVASITDPLNHTTTFTYDSKGNLTTVKDPLLSTTTLAYNTAGQPTSITDPLSNTTSFAYDLGDLATVTDPLGNGTSRFIDSAGRLLSLTNPLGYLTRYDYDTLNRLTKVTDPLSGVTQFGYDPNGNLLSVTDARNNPTTYTYNNMDRLATRKDPLLVTESYLYDADGNLSRFTDRKAQATNFTYDALNRRKTATYADASTTTYTYDAGNRLIQVVDSVSGTITLTYDNLDRLTQEVTPQGTVSYTYDAAGRRTSMTVAGQPTVTYTYDNANRLTQITQGTNTAIFAYDAAGRRTSLTLPNGVVVQYGYDTASRLTSITYSNGATVLGNLTYEYDAAGNRVKVGGTWARTGLPQAVSSATYNAANQMITFGSQSLSYDANGNLTSDGTNSYGWDARNRMSSMTGASFVYDPMGRRVTKTISGVSTNYLYDSVNPVQELSGTTPTANLLTGLGIDEYLMRTDSAGARNFLTDALGSTLALTDSAGTVQTSYTYEPFGKTTTSGATSSNPSQYTGRENDGTGLYYYRARYYSSTLSRFLSEDSFNIHELQLLRQRTDLNPLLGFLAHRFYRFYLHDPRHFNAYMYVWNSPVSFRDPSGLWSISFEGYAGLGGGVIFGVNPTGGTFITWRFGYGLGGGVGYDPWGTSPDWGDRKSRGVSWGGFAEAGVNLWSINLGASVQGGIGGDVPGGLNPYFDPYIGPQGLSPQRGFSAGYSGGIEISIHP